MSKCSMKDLAIILHEIYGINDHIHYYKNVLTSKGFEVICPHLLGRESFPYEREEEAYHYFMNEVGFPKAMDEVKRLIHENREKYERIFIIGFSAGATIAWACSESKSEVDGIVGYYGSRIRNYMDTEPACPTLLFFPAHEKSFDVLDLERKLQTKKNTAVEIIEAEHGFMNPYYTTYNPIESTKCIKKSIHFLRDIVDRE
jgi:dienelactone hydrolase